MSLKLSDSLIAISKESLKWAYKWGGRLGLVIYEGIDVKNYSCYYINIKKRKNEPQIVTIAYLGKDNIVRKDLFTLIKSLGLVKEIYPTIKLYIIGEKKEGYIALKKLAKKIGVDKNIIFTGFISHRDLLKLLCSSDLFVMTSYHEGFPTAACEAAAAGLPVIVSDRPAMNEVFSPQNALIVKPGSPTKLAEAIIDLLRNKKLANRIARQGSQTVRENFSLYARKKKLTKLVLLFAREIKAELHSRGYYRVNTKYLLLFLLLSLTIRLIKKSYDVIKLLISLIY